MSEIARWNQWNSQMFQNDSGWWVRYVDHQAEVERLAAERDAAQAEVERLKAEMEGKQCDQGILQTLLESERGEVATLTTKCNAAQAEIDRLTWELLGKVNEAHRVTVERDAAQAEVERLRKEANGLTAPMVGRVMAERDLANAEVERLTAERDVAQIEVERLRTTLAWADATIYRLKAERDQTATNPKGREVGAGSPSDQSEQNLDMVANCKETLTSSRPTDEDIWREAFMVQLMKTSSYQWERSSEEADLVLTTYRKRWPR